MGECGRGTWIGRDNVEAVEAEHVEDGAQGDGSSNRGSKASFVLTGFMLYNAFWDSVSQELYGSDDKDKGHTAKNPGQAGKTCTASKAAMSIPVGRLGGSSSSSSHELAGMPVASILSHAALMHQNQQLQAMVNQQQQMAIRDVYDVS